MPFEKFDHVVPVHSTRQKGSQLVMSFYWSTLYMQHDATMEPLSSFVWLPYKVWEQRSFEGFSCMSATVFDNERFPRKSHQVYKQDITKLGQYTTLLINYLDPRISFLLTSQKSRMDKKTDRSEAYPLHSLGFKLWNCTGIPQTATPPCRTPNVRWWTWWRWCNAALLTCLSNAQIGWRWGLVYPHTVH